MTKLKISNVVRSQLPEFIQGDSSFENFKSFLEAYYEFLNETNQRDIESLKDIDQSLDEFIYQFRKEFNYDVAYSGNEALFLRNIKQLYSSKGSEASFKLLFRLLFNKNVDLVYPGNSLLIPSDGKWIQDTTIFANITGDASLVVGKEIIIKTSLQSITVFVERVRVISGSITQIFINKNYYGEITVGSTIESDIITGTVLPTISKVTVVDQGTGFKIGKLYDIIGSGTGAKIKITRVEENGGVMYAQLIQFGLGYGAEDILYSIDDCVLKLSIGAIAKYPGYFNTNDGFLSDAIYLQDSKYFQYYSYVIKIDEQLESYRNIVKKYIHPAGFAMFGEYTIDNEFEIQTIIESTVS